LPEAREVVRQLTGDVGLIIADPPYGNILTNKWDRVNESEEQFAQWMCDWTHMWSDMLLPNAAFYVWGGIGRPGFRPFFRYIPEVENGNVLQLANLITWSKKRAYGVKHNYLFTREELAYFIKGDDIKKPRCFNIPLLETKRGYAGFNAKYPAKSEFYRRTNVWMDVTEMMRGKVHDAQKAQRVIEIPIEVHTNPGEWVIDPFAGAGTTAHAARKLGRRFVVIEKDEKTFEELIDRLRIAPVNEPSSVIES
jgi:site-specific DNA-methyltransferase (adenine-specific)